MGPLHVEMALLKLLVIGWKVADDLEALTRQISAYLAELIASFREVMLKDLFALRSIAQEAYQESGCRSHEDWENQLKSKSVNTK